MKPHTRSVSTPPVDQFITFLPATDLAEVDRFYGQLLGLEMALDQGTCRIFRITAGAFVGFCMGPARIDPPEAVILTLVTDAVSEWHASLVAHCVATDGPPRVNERYQIEHFFAMDPNGYRIEVQRFLDSRWRR